MGISDYLILDNPEVFAIAVGVLVFVLANAVLGRFLHNRGVSIIFSLVVGIFTAWQLYQERFYGYEGTVIVIMYIVVAGILLKIFWAFVKGAKHRFG